MWGWCMCVCLYVSMWRERKNWVLSYLFKQSHKCTQKFILPISSVLSVLPVVSSVSWKSHCISTHYNDVKWRIMLYSSVWKVLHWHNPYLNISFIYWGSQSLSSFMYCGTWGRNHDTYLRLGMRYEDVICTIVISMNRAFKWCPFCCRLNFDPKLWKTMDYSLWLRAIFGKNETSIQNDF